jgi:hypothetical protein
LPRKQLFFAAFCSVDNASTSLYADVGKKSSVAAARAGFSRFFYAAAPRFADQSANRPIKKQRFILGATVPERYGRFQIDKTKRDRSPTPSGFASAPRFGRVVKNCRVR